MFGIIDNSENEKKKRSKPPIQFKYLTGEGGKHNVMDGRNEENE